MKNRNIHILACFTMALVSANPSWAEIPGSNPASAVADPPLSSVLAPDQATKAILEAPLKDEKSETKAKYELNADAPAVKDDDPLCICHEASREYELGHYEKSLELYKKYVAQLEKQEGPNSLDVGRMLQNVGLCNQELSRYDEALAAFNRALVITKSRSQDHLSDYADTLIYLGNLYRDQNKFTKSIELETEAVKLLENAPNQSKQLSHALYCLGYVNYVMGAHDQARVLFERAVAIREKLNLHDLETSKVTAQLAKTYVDEKAYAKAETLYEKRIAMVNALFKPNTKQAVEAALNLALVYQLEGKTAKELDVYQQYLAAAKANACANDPITFNVFREAGDKLIDQGQFTQALEYYDQILSTEKDGKDYANDLDGYAVVLFKTGQYDKAETICKRIILVITSEKNIEHAKLNAAYKNYAKLLRATNRESQAEELEKLAKSY